MTGRPADDDARPLTEDEQRSLELIERTLRDEEPALNRRLEVRRSPGLIGASIKELAIGLVLAGFALTYVGIVLDAALVGFGGFLLMLLGIDHLVRGVDGQRLVARLLRLVGLGSKQPPASGSGRE